MQKNCQCSSQGQGQGLDLRAALKPRPGLDDYITDTHISVPPPVPTPANKQSYKHTDQKTHRLLLARKYKHATYMYNFILDRQVHIA